MKFRPSSLLIVVKARNAAAIRTAQDITVWLKERGVRSRLVSSTGAGAVHNGFNPALADGMDAVLVLGGDGTMLGIARALQPRSIPLLGINFGRVGFLTEISASDWQRPLQNLLDGTFSVEQYRSLHWELIRSSGEHSDEGWAINDVVLARGTVARAVTLDLGVNDIFMARLKCDGVIVSTALGSTAYAAAAGGPLMFPALNAALITPLSPFAGSFHPMVVPADATVSLTAVHSVGQMFVTIDGQEWLPVMPDDEVRVTCNAEVSMLVSDRQWYLQRLTQRGFIQPGPRRPGKVTVQEEESSEPPVQE